MGRERKNKKGEIKVACILLVATFLVLSFPLWVAGAKIAYAQTQSVILNPMPFTPGSKFGMRMHPIQKVMKLHGGQDYPIPVGTNVPFQGTIIECKPNNGSAGNMAIVGNACDVKQVFMHLQHCSNTTITSGNSGGSTGPHLHYEIHIAGTKVDPIKAFGKDLCKGDVRKMLLDDAKNNGSGSGGGGAAADSNAPGPSGNQPVDSVTYVDPGQPDPGTGVVNDGPGYYYIEKPDGTVIRDLEFSSFDVDTPIMNPTTDDVVPTGESANEVTGCATDTWAAMVNQSVLQTRRETVINQRYILKGDSVMAYSCFEDQLKKAGEHMGVFSETKRWVNVQVDVSSAPNVGSLGPGKIVKFVTINKELGENTLDGAIMNTANFVFTTHARTNFKHGLLGGLYETSPEGGSEGYEDFGQDGMPCGTMAKVWQMAKCLNMEDNPLFPKFEELIESKSDPRKYPANMACNDTGITQKMIDIAKQKEVDNSKLETHLKLIYPTEGCHTVKTGVTVERQEGAGIISRKVKYDDGVCTTVGCVYTKGGECKPTS